VGRDRFEYRTFYLRNVQMGILAYQGLEPLLAEQAAISVSFFGNAVGLGDEHITGRPRYLLLLKNRRLQIKSTEDGIQCG
jgi:hypothetical protein